MLESNELSNLIGREFGSVALIRELGRGNMSAVYVGFQKTLKRQVAVKILSKAAVTRETSRERFRDEAEIVAGLTHPNIIPIFEMGETDEYYYQVMQLVNGTDLHSIIKRRLQHPVPSKRLLPLEQTLDISIQVLDGLGCAHREAIVHQDIKPANILVETPGGRPLIADFGIAKARHVGHEWDGVIRGTPLYLSPEQAATEPTDKRSDIYSFGLILFEMLAGELPLHKEDIREMLVRKLKHPHTIFTARPSEVSPLIDHDLEFIILTATAADRGGRYQDCADFRTDLVRYRNRHVPSVMHDRKAAL